MEGKGMSELAQKWLYTTQTQRKTSCKENAKLFLIGRQRKTKLKNNWYYRIFVLFVEHKHTVGINVNCSKQMNKKIYLVSGAYALEYEDIE